MPTAKIKPGDRYTFTGKAGLAETLTGETPRTDDQGLNHAVLDMPAGCEVTVRELVAAETKGAHNDDEDAWVVAWTDDLGNPRATSVGVETFDKHFRKA